MYKKITALLLVVVLMCVPVYARATSQSTEIYINGEKVNSDVPPIISKGRTLVPLRIISQNLGAKVHWDNNSKTVYIEGPKKIELKVNNEEAIVDGKKQNIDMPAIIVQKRTMVPLRFISEVFDSKVHWDNAAKRVIITKKPKSQGDIVDFTYKIVESKPAIVVKGDAPLKYKVKNSADDQLKIDIEGEIKTSNETLYIYDEILKTAKIYNVQKEPPLTRLVLDFVSKGNYQIKESLDKKTIFIYLFSTNQLENIKLQTKGENIQAKISTSKPSDINYFILQNPARLVLDIKSTLWDEKIYDDVPENDLIKSVRTSQFSEDPYVVRVVFDLKDEKVKYSLSHDRSEIKIDFYRPDDFEGVVTEPEDFKGKTVVIDPGHGGSDPGAIRNGVTEKFLNLDIGLRVRDILKQKGINVLMTRDKDIYVDLYVRAGIANDIGADVFVSIHNNTASATGATGTETLYYPNSENKKLALAIQKAICDATGLKNRGIVQRPGLVVTRETQMPSALVEVAFMSNPRDLSLLLDEGFRQKVAEGIARGIINFLTGQS